MQLDLNLEGGTMPLPVVLELHGADAELVVLACGPFATPELLSMLASLTPEGVTITVDCDGWEAVETPSIERRETHDWSLGECSQFAGVERLQ